MGMTTSVRQAGDVTVVDIKGRIVLGEENAALRTLVSDLLSQGHKKILFNLRDVDHIDSMGMGCLVGVYTTMKKQGGELKLLHLSSKVSDVMEITKLYTVFDITDDEETAMKAFAKSGAASA